MFCSPDFVTLILCYKIRIGKTTTKSPVRIQPETIICMRKFLENMTVAKLFLILLSIHLIVIVGLVYYDVYCTQARIAKVRSEIPQQQQLVDAIVEAMSTKMTPSTPPPTAEEISKVLMEKLPANLLGVPTKEEMAAALPSLKEISSLLDARVPTVDEIWLKPFKGVTPGDGKSYFISEYEDGSIDWESETMSQP